MTNLPLKDRFRDLRINNNAIPTLSAKNLSKGITRKDILRIEGSGIEVVSGGIIDDALYDRVSPVEHRPAMIFTSVPSFGTREVQWIVRGSGTAKIMFQSLKATDRSRTVQL